MCERYRKKGGAFILGSWGVNLDDFEKFPTDFAENWHTASWTCCKNFVLLTFCPNRRLCWRKTQISVSEGQKWEFFDFDGKYLKLGCSERQATADMFCSALRWAFADVSLVFLWKKLSKIWPIFWPQTRNHFFVSANFAYFFSFWPSQGVTPGRIQSRQIHLAWNPGSFFLPGNWKSSLFIDIVQLYLDRIFRFFASSFHESFKFFWIEPSADIQEYHKQHVPIKKWRFFTFFVVYHEMFCALYIWNF